MQMRRSGVRFPRLEPDLLRGRLVPPDGPVRVLIDTDAANEIDDQFALAWALLSRDRLRIEAVTAAPFSFQHHRAGLLAAEAWLDGAAGRHPGRSQRTAAAVDESHLAWAQRLHSEGRRATDVEFVSPAEGMERSYQEILRVFDALRMARAGRIVRGATGYLTSLEAPPTPLAAEAIIDLAKSGDSRDPLYVVAIGCVTNVAAALLQAPEIVRDVVLVWTSAYPSSAPHCNRPSLNLMQDPLASRLLFNCGAPLVYLPGFHVGAQLRVSRPEMDAFVRGRSAIGDLLHDLYTDNPLHRMWASQHDAKRTWIIWDIITIAWLLNPNWVPTHLTRAPILTDELFWRQDSSRHIMREGHDVQRDEIFMDLYDKVAAAAD
ncbi:MAG: hypothetical protein F4Y86_05860 [Gammaproteobacteria bacterium]|nr:hypothetical protein [Gammaproteobacteria bacterium]